MPMRTLLELDRVTSGYGRLPVLRGGSLRVRRALDCAAADAGDRARRACAGAGVAPAVRIDDGRGEPADGRLCAPRSRRCRGDTRRAAAAVPDPCRAAPAGGTDLERR